MGCACDRSVGILHTSSPVFAAQRELEYATNIKPILEKYPHILDYKFTNFDFNFVEYIISIHNNELLESCYSLNTDISEIPIGDEDMLHLAIKCRNADAVQIMLDKSPKSEDEHER
jgi:hypothetical protein